MSTDPQVEVVTDASPPVEAVNEKRGRGRPKGSPNKPKGEKKDAAPKVKAPSEEELLQAQMTVGLFAMAVGGLGPAWGASVEKHAPMLMDASIKLQRAYPVQMSEKQQAWMAVSIACFAVVNDAGGFQQFSAWVQSKMEAQRQPAQAPEVDANAQPPQSA